MGIEARRRRHPEIRAVTRTVAEVNEKTVECLWQWAAKADPVSRKSFPRPSSNRRKLASSEDEQDEDESGEDEDEDEDEAESEDDEDDHKKSKKKSKQPETSANAAGSDTWCISSRTERL